MDLSMDETLQALADAGLVETESPAVMEDASESAAGTADVSDVAEAESSEDDASGGLLDGLLGDDGLLSGAAPMIAAGFIGSKLTGGKSTGNAVTDTLNTVTAVVSQGSETKTVKQQPKSGIMDKLSSLPGMAATPLDQTVQGMLESFAGSSGSGSIMDDFSSALAEISAKSKSSRPLPAIASLLPDAAKSVESFVPGLGG